MEAKHITQYFDFTNIKHKHFFAGLLNTAQHNFNLSLTELARRINSNDQINKGFIKIAFKDDISESDWERRTNYLSESLVFVKYIEYEKRDEFRNQLLVLYETLDALRNYYTHYKRGKTPIDASIFKLLDYLLFVSAMEVKRNRAKSEEYKEFLSVKYEDEFDEIIETSNKKIEEYNVQLKKGEKRREFVKPNDEINHVLNKVFRTFLFKNEKGEDELSKFASSKNEQTNDLSTNGFAQLLALFLNKKQTESLLSYTKYLKDTRKLKFVISRWTLNYLCYRNIKRSLKSDYSDDSLLLQLVSELNKCPNEIYKHLTPEKKQEFIEDINEYYKDNVAFDKSPQQALVSHEVIQKRYENKSPYFILRFLDEVIDFPTLKFQVNLGKFNHNTSKKTFNNAIETERSILDRITVFTNLSKATENKKEYIKNSKNLNSDNQWLEFPMPSYQFNKDNIGIWLKMNDDSGKSDAPEKKASGKLSKYDIACKLDLKDAVKKPVAFLSFNEFPAMLYALLIEKKTPKHVEQIIRNKIIEQKKLISSFDGTKIGDKKLLPKKLLQSQIETGIDIKKLKESIETEIKKNLLLEIRKLYKKPVENDKDLTDREKGKIATWLADDIKRFTSESTKKNWKGYQYPEFQSLFSFYDRKKKGLEQFLVNDLSFNYAIDNPASGVNFKYKTLYDFYDNYVKRRCEYLKNWLNIINSDVKNIPEAVFTGFTKRLYEIKPLDTQKHIFLKEVPINLPKGIFDSKPTVYDRKIHEDVVLADWFTRSNNANTAQKFYGFEKVYPYTIEKFVFDRSVGKKKLKPYEITQTINPNKPIKQQYHKTLPKEKQIAIYKNERNIRKRMREDFYLLEMVKYLLDYESTENIQLKDVFLTKVEKATIEKLSKKQSERKKGDNDNKVINDSYILSREITVSTLDNKIVDVVKMKDIGKFRKLELDERVIQLVKYFPNKRTWTAKEINDEIEDYESIRKFEFFKSVHELEEIIFDDAEQNNSLNELLQNNKPNFKMYLSYYFLNTNKEDFNKLNFEKISVSHTSLKPEWYKLYLLASIRNRFSHSQLLPKPDFDYLKELVPLNDHEKIASFLNRAFKELMSGKK